MSQDYTAFNAHGQAEPAVDAVYPDEPEIQAAIEQAREDGFREGIAAGRNMVFDLCLLPARDMEQAGRRLAALAYVRAFDYDPVKSVRGLAELWGVSSARAFELLDAFRANFQVKPKD